MGVECLGPLASYLDLGCPRGHLEGARILCDYKTVFRLNRVVLISGNQVLVDQRRHYTVFTTAGAPQCTGVIGLRCSVRLYTNTKYRGCIQPAEALVV
jgi:hypothetical protein